MSAGTLAARFEFRFKIVFVDDVENSKKIPHSISLQNKQILLCFAWMNRNTNDKLSVSTCLSLFLRNKNAPETSFEGFRKNVEIFQKFCD